MNIELVFIPADDMMGNADCLRMAAPKIRGDFVVVSSDVILETSLQSLVRLYKSNTADMVCLFATMPNEDTPDKKAGTTSSGRAKIEEEDQEYVGLCSDGRLVVKCAALEVEEAISIGKNMLSKCTGLCLRNDLVDMGVYVMSRWLLDLLSQNKKLSSLRTDLVPFLVNRQFRTPQYLAMNVPSVLASRSRPLSELDPWLLCSGNKYSNARTAAMLSGRCPTGVSLF